MRFSFELNVSALDSLSVALLLMLGLLELALLISLAYYLTGVAVLLKVTGPLLSYLVLLAFRFFSLLGVKAGGGLSTYADWLASSGTDSTLDRF